MGRNESQLYPYPLLVACPCVVWLLCAPTALGEDAPAYEFQSRTLFGSVYGDAIHHTLGMPAPTTYTVDEYSHARAR